MKIGKMENQTVSVKKRVSKCIPLINGLIIRYDVNQLLCVNDHYLNIINKIYQHNFIQDQQGLWNDITCEHEFKPICQYYPEGDPYAYKKEWPTSGGCPEGWWQYAGACYILPTQGSGYFDAFDLKRYDDAEKEISSKNMENTAK